MRLARMTSFAGTLCLAGTCVLGEDLGQLAVGTRVRVATAQQTPRLVGTVAAVDAKSLMLQVPNLADPVLVRRGDITSLAVSKGRGSRLRGALYGTIIGAGAGATVGIVGGIAGNSGHSSDDKKMGALVGGVLFAMLGAPIGAVVGAVIPPRERWRELATEHVQVGFGLVRGGGRSVRVAIVF